MKNMLNIKEIQTKKHLYEFRLTYKSKCEIEQASSKDLDIFADNEVVQVLPYVEKLDDKELSDTERVEILAKIAPIMGKMQSMKSGLDPVELGYILLHNLKGNEGISKEQYFDEIIPEIEEEIGLEKMYQEFVELHEEVFIRMEQLNSLTNKTSFVPKDAKLTS